MSYQRAEQFEGELSFRKNTILILLAVFGVILSVVGAWLLFTTPEATASEAPAAAVSE